MSSLQFGEEGEAAEGLASKLGTLWTIATEPYTDAHFATFPKKLVERCVMAGTSERGHCPECGKRWVRRVKPSEEYGRHLAKNPRKLGYFDSKLLGEYLLERRTALGLLASEVDEALGGSTAYFWWEGRAYKGNFVQVVPSWENYLKLKQVLELDDRFDASLEREAGSGEFTMSADGVPEGVKRMAGPRKNSEYLTVGWVPTCSHNLDPLPDIVLDPFLGSGTTAEVAERLGRGWIGIDLNPAYEAMQAKRTAQMGISL